VANKRVHIVVAGRLQLVLRQIYATAFSRSFLQCSDCVGWATGRASSLYKVGCSFVGGDDLELSGLVVPVVTTSSLILSSNQIQNGDGLVIANLDPSGKGPLKRREIYSIFKGHEKSFKMPVKGSAGCLLAANFSKAES